MRKLSFRCPDGVVKLIINAPEELEERVIGICYNVFRRAIVGKDKSRTAARFKRAINADAFVEPQKATARYMSASQLNERERAYSGAPSFKVPVS